MKQRIALLFSSLMIAVFTLYLIPHELVHVLYDHTDTEHADADHHSRASISVVHIHCDFLNTEITDFTAATEHQTPVAYCELRHHFSQVDVQSLRAVTALRESRGPPVLS